MKKFMFLSCGISAIVVAVCSVCLLVNNNLHNDCCDVEIRFGVNRAENKILAKNVSMEHLEEILVLMNLAADNLDENFDYVQQQLFLSKEQEKMVRKYIEEHKEHSDQIGNTPGTGGAY